MKVEMEGFDEAIAEIDRLIDSTDKLRDEALIQGGDLLKKQVEQEVYSHGLTRRSGDAQESISRSEPEGGELFVGVEGPGFYLYMHEFGYYNVRAQRFIAPLPLMSVVFENNKNRILDEYAKVFRRGYNM